MADAVAADVKAGGRPTVVTGDCLAILGTLAGLQRAGVHAAIVWFDTHGDVHTLS
jgi:arginase